uniref:Phosphoribosylaminoimidazole-succinocarboxamide synthase, chloroplastic n=1 Tax=Chloropicon laureae TaxID=464258 RepID=A0A7S2YVU4_9CHLO|mmetsp:Transcript_11143/g.28608  ORF Transcript_11143/g.28608 Transcript_11143/m.28608 type:complete len:391 (+) Transcript_11143:131-1303(+)
MKIDRGLCGGSRAAGTGRKAFATLSASASQGRRAAGGRSIAGCASRPRTARVKTMAGSPSSSPSSFVKSDEIEEKIRLMLDNCLSSTSLAKGIKREGKVRDLYELDDKVVSVTTDRQSGFDRHLASVPFKGQVVNETSVWWLNQTRDLVPNALVSAPHPNVAIMKKCRVFPVEFVVRGYLTGSTGTSIWTNYSKGVRSYCGNDLPDGLVKNDKLERNIVTPTTKAESGDVPITPQEIVEQGLMTQEEWNYASGKALALFTFGQEVALKNGLLLVDTKYEFGVDDDGNILLIDEIHTPDSSRYWIADTYKALHAEGKEPENIDKEFLRLWFKDHCDPYNDLELPEAPDSLIIELSRRYITLYETITGQAFEPASSDLYQGSKLAESVEKDI